jgi:PTH1 family peptidyl-tRNA hydrolase
MKLIIGLGNPGRNYAHNRHNIGFLCLRHFTKKQGIPLDKKQGQARTGIGDVAGNKLMVARPQTHMNLSGESVGRLVKKSNVSLDNLIIIHDDLDLPLGKIRVRQGGGSGGHKGIESIIAQLNSPDFLRVRVGIGRPPLFENNTTNKETEIIDYVLSDFTNEERKTVNQVITKASDAVLCLLKEGLNAAMNKYN